MKKLSICLLVATLVLAGCGGSAQPKASATFSGPIKIDADKAESAYLSFTISEDGTAITEVGISFTNFKCEGMSAGSMTLGKGGKFPIANGLELSPDGIGQIKGRFTSSTKAKGTIHIQLGNSTGSLSCGTWDWSAEAK